MTEVRTVNDFNSEYMYECWLDEVKAIGQPKKGEVIKNAVFYGLLIAMVLLAFFYSGGDEPAKRFGPFAYNTVLTGSMESVYSTGSLITSWAVQPNEPLMAGLENGTDIVFVKENGDVVVHRIIEIFENYEDSGQRAFRTQGTDNPMPDNWIIYEGNVVGRVTWHVPYVGNILALIASNILLFMGGVAVLCILFSLWKIVFTKDEKKKQN